MSKLEHIMSFINIVEENGFAAAARKQGISTAAISRQMAQLESKLKTELLRRTTRRIELTEIGSQYYHQCKKILEDLAEAETAIASSRRHATGTLNITSSRYFAMQYLLPRLPKFMALNPKLKINLELAERFPDLAAEGVDILFGVSMAGGPELVQKRVATARYVFCASSSYLKKYGMPKTPADLNHHHYINHSMRKKNVITLHADETKEIHIEPTLLLNDSRAMCECAILGLGVVRLHDYIVAEALEDGRLIEILKEFREPKMPVYLYYQQSRYLLPKIRRFIDFYTLQ